MARSRKNKIARLDLSELEINETLMEDLRHYVGSPKVYVPKIWDLCLEVLRETNRIILNERDNGEMFDYIYDEFFEEFDQSKFGRVLAEHHISVRRADYQKHQAQFYFDVFMLLYSQVASIVDNQARDLGKAVETLNFTVEVTRVHYDVFNDGFGEVEREVAVDVVLRKENMLTSRLLSGEGYEF